MAYKVLSRLKYNGVYFDAGSIVDIDPKETERLLKLGVISYPSTDEVKEIIETSKEIEKPENEDNRNYEAWDYKDVKSEFYDRKLTAESAKGVDLIAALKADDVEFDALIVELEAKNITLPEEATTEELKELIEQSNNRGESKNDDN